MKYLSSILLSLSLFCPVYAQRTNLSVQKPEADNSVEAELKSFEVSEGYVVNLFAAAAPPAAARLPHADRTRSRGLGQPPREGLVFPGRSGSLSAARLQGPGEAARLLVPPTA